MPGGVRVPNIATQTVVVLVVLAVSLSAASPPAARAAVESGAESVSRRIEVAEFQLRSGRWQDAVDILAPLAEAPDAPASVFRGLGEAYLNLGRRDDAVRALTEAQRRGDARARTLLIGLLGDERSTWPQAIELLQQQVKADPADIDARRRLGELLVYENRVADAVPVLRDVVAARPDDAPALLLYARTLAWTGDFAAAAPAFDRALAVGAALQPEDTRLFAQAKEAVGDAKGANAQYRAFVQAQPNDPVALAGLARTALATGREAEAKQAIASLRPLAATDPDVALAVARLDVAAGDRDAALPVFAAALAASPDPQLAREYADALVAAGRVDEAIEVVNRHPDDSAAGRAARLRILAASPQHRREAQQLALELVREAPGPEVSRAARQVVLASPERELSLDLVDAVARQYPQDRAVQQKLAGMLLARGQKQRAEGVLARLGGGAGRDPELVASLAATQVANGNYAGARQTLDAAGTLVDRDARLLSLRAGLRFRDGDLRGARADYAAALERAPRRPEARIGLAEVALAEGNVAEAEALLAAPPELPQRQVADLRRRLALQEKLARYRSRPSPELATELTPLLNAELERDPARSDYRLVLAQILEAEGRSREALEQFRQLQQVEPPLREAWLGPVRLHLARGENDAAEQAFARFQERFPGEEDVAQARLFAGKGERRKRAGDYDGALEAYRKAVEMAPRNAEIRNGIAGVHFHFGNTELALAEFETALEIDPDDAAARRGTVDALTALAGDALERGDRDAAGSWLDRALAASGSDAAALERTAQLAVAARDWDVARAAAERLPDGPQARALQARVGLEAELDRNRRDPETVPPRELLDLARRGLELDPSRSDLRLLEAQALERLGDTEAAASAFRAAAESGSTSADAWAGQVRTLAALGRVRAARAAFDELAVRDATAAAEAELPLALAEASVLKAEGRPHEALAATERARALDPDDAGVLATQAGLYTETGDLPRAIDAYRDALTLRPQDPDLLLGLAGAYFAGGQLDDALAAFDEALRLDPGNRRAVVGRTDVLAGLAAAAVERGDRKDAVALARDSLRGSAGVDAALERTVETAVRAGAWDVAADAADGLSDAARRAQLARYVEVERALEDVRRAPGGAGPAELALVDEALRLQPERADLLLLRAQALERAGDAEGALRAYRRLAELPGAPAEAWAGQVRVLSALGRTREAAAALAAVRRDDPAAAGDAEVVLLLAEAEVAKRGRRYGEALDAIRRALVLEPDNVDAHLALAGVYAAAGQHGDAIAAYETVLDARPGDVVAREGLAGALFASGDLAAAARVYDDLLDDAPQAASLRASRTSLAVAEAGQALAAGRVGAAERALDRALALEPGNRDALAMKLQIMAGREDFAGARQRIAAVSDRAWRRELESWLAVEEGVARWRADRNALPAAEALRLADQGLRADPGRTDLRLMRAQVLEASGDERAALAAYRDLAGREGAPADAVAGEVRMLIALERFDEAEALLDRLVVLRPEAADSERATLFRARAAALRELGQPTRAFASARDALALHPGDADTLALLGWIYLDTTQPADAAASFAAALDRRPDDVAALQGLATAYEALGDWNAAERTWVRLASLPAGSFPAEARERIAVQRSFAQVQALRAEGRLAAAADLLERLRASQPRNPDVWAALSEVRNEMNQGSLALTAAEQGLQLAPESGRLHLARVRALARLGRFDEARRAIAAARGHAADAELARLGSEVERAVARAERERWMREGRLDLAYLALAEEYQLAPNDADVLRAIGYLYLETGQYADARQFFERAVRLDPQNPAGQMGLAYALRGDGEPGEAIERIESVMAARPSAEAALALAELYHEQGRDRKAAEMLAYARRYGGAPRRVLAPLHIDRARAVAPELRAERGSVLPPLMLPEGVMRAVPDRPPAVPVYEEMRRGSGQRSGWSGDDRLGRAATEPIVLAFADSGVVSDAAPPEAWAFAGPGLDALRRGFDGGAAPLQLAQALPGFDRVMEDARGGSRAPVYEPAPAVEEGIRDEYLPGDGSHESYGTHGTYGAPQAPAAGRATVEDYIPAAPQPAGSYRYAIDPTLPAQPRPDAPTPYEQRYRYYEYGDVAPGTAPEPELPNLPPALPPAYGGALYLEREPAGAGLPIREPIAPPTPLDPEARARMTALERKLERAQTMKVSVGFRYDFLDEVSDVIADQFVLWRFPLYLEVPALLGSRLRVTGEPTIIDNGIVTDSGVAGEVAVLGLRLGTDIATASFGAGVTPAGFRDNPDVTGFARLTLQLARRLTLTPFFERKPVIESLLSYRGNEFEDIFFGKVMQNRFGGTIGYDTPQEINGVFEVAYSTLEGTRVEDNNKIDAFFSIGRDFDIGSDFVVRPGAQAYFFHYDEDLSSAWPLGLDPVLFPPDEFQPGAGYFSPDSFLEAVLRLDLRGPLLPDTFPGSTFRIGGRVGGQWISGVEAAEFESAEGSRATFGGDGGIEVPFGEVVVFSAGAGFVVADPYNRIYFEMALLFPL